MMLSPIEFVHPVEAELVMTINEHETITAIYPYQRILCCLIQ